MLRIILVRHGESTANKEHRYAGCSDFPLTDTGKMQARRIAERLSGEDVTAIYSSNLSRAMETARFIAARFGLSIKEEPSLREIDFGEWEGLTYDEIGISWAELRDAWVADPVNISPPGGETLTRLQKRSVEAFLKIVRQHNQGSVVIVSHAGPIRSILCKLQGRDISSFWDIPVQPGDIIVVDFENSSLKDIVISA
ncbi:MAG: alpha-ribazole phosphatase [Thermosediminibacterales bacterium]|nr:alpha-ribazole phosphatase [Thermosediminibacterales bacterium]MDK2835790.1 alpha-ribazole phosphatase [Thermosediminibacterales bacterium]